MSAIWNVIVGFLNWLWSLILLPITFQRCVKLLTDVNMKLESPSKYNEELKWAKEIFDMKIKQAEEEKSKLAESDTQKQKDLVKFIGELGLAKTEIQSLIEKNKKAEEESDLFFSAYKELSGRNEKLIGLIVKSQSILPPLPRPHNLLGNITTGQVLGSFPLANALFESPQKSKTSPTADDMAQLLKDDKKENGG